MKKQDGKMKLIVIILIVVILALGGAVGYMFWSKSNEPDPNAEPEPEPIVVVDPIFMKIGPMTVNIHSRRGDRLLYISFMLKVADETSESFLQTRIPDINNRLLILLSDQSAEELTAPGGKQLVANKILETLRKPYTDPQPEIVIEDVLFQDFIVQ